MRFAGSKSKVRQPDTQLLLLSTCTIGDGHIVTYRYDCTHEQSAYDTHAVAHCIRLYLTSIAMT